MKHSFDITGFQLKIVAIIAMTCNHVANVFGVATLGAPLCFALYAVGGITFPIMAFLVVEGYAHTSNLRKYALRLAAFAAVSQLPYHLVFGSRLNVLFTLLLGLGILWLCGRFNFGVGLVAAIVGTALLHGTMDWGTDGLIIIYLFGTLREAQRGRFKRGDHPQTPNDPAQSFSAACSDTVCSGVVCNDAICNEPIYSDAVCSDAACSATTRSVITCHDAAYTEVACNDAACSDVVCNDVAYNDAVCSAVTLCEMKDDQNSNILVRHECADVCSEDVSRETLRSRRSDLITIIGTMMVPLVVTCSTALKFSNIFTAGYALVGYTIATVLLCGYRGRRGRSMKWLFYAYYPLHLFALWLIRVAFM